jgi:hypothetical protein
MYFTTYTSNAINTLDTFIATYITISSLLNVYNIAGERAKLSFGHKS